ncbi:Regulatory protein SoxS [Gimesia panareensis]|uniref:Regulatory protein SoxS n=1 Tax=Gimesia panareensis TaxID=2527978 RepID=A0A517Q493_9PLAN|nr:AraC family transcriptional regulator [Gimesia panareensis]QDT26461.1 Regulatory protein SoxS [Gimesia panareensis]
MIRAFLNQLDQPFTGEALFDHLPDIVYFIKDAQGAYLVVNSTLQQRCGLQHKSQLLGRTPCEVFRAPLGNRFQEQDQRVLATGKPLLSQLELHVYPSRAVGWCLTTKLPLTNQDGEIVGLVGVSQDLQLPDYETDEYQHVATAIQYAEEHLSEPPSIPELAAQARMSRYQFDRRIRRVFGLNASQWLLKLRIDQAQQQLHETDDPISAIAVDVGYADQSAFTRQFRRTTGMTPQDYRRTGKQKS